MKKINLNHCGFLIIIIIFLQGCAFDLFKDMGDVCYLEVEMVHVDVTSENNATLVGKITDPGDYPVEYVGFCFNQKGSPDLLDNQHLAESIDVDGQFSMDVSGLKPDSTYYFRAFLASKCGYVLSEAIITTVPVFAPPVAPCTLKDDVVRDNNNNYAVSDVSAGEVYAGWGKYGVHVSCYDSGGPTLYFDFNDVPFTGSYNTTTTEKLNTNYRNVNVSIHKGGDIYGIREGGEVYIEKGDNQFVTIYFCDLEYKILTYELKVSGKATFSL